MDNIISGVSGETLVKLANIGFSGICIFVVFWTGLMISRFSKEDPKSKFWLILAFMGLTLGMSATSAWLTWKLAENNAGKVKEAEEKVAAAEQKAQSTEQLLATAKNWSGYQEAVKAATAQYTAHLKNKADQLNLDESVMTQLRALADETEKSALTQIAKRETPSPGNLSPLIKEELRQKFKDSQPQNANPK